MHDNSFSLPSRYGIEAYISQAGYVCLKQDLEEFETCEEGKVILMLPSDVPQIIEWLQHLRQEAIDIAADQVADK